MDINHKYPFVFLSLRLPVENFCCRTFCCILMLLCLFAPCLAQTDSSTLFSPSVGQTFYEIAYELANLNSQTTITQSQIEQAIIFLTATIELDTRADYVQADIIKLASESTEKDYSLLILQLLEGYIDESADLEAVTSAVRYFLENLNSREEREELLLVLLQNLRDKNNALASELSTLLGLLAAEKTDLQSAQLYLADAYDDNKYNTLAFEKLIELTTGQAEPAMYIEHLRLVLEKNPFDMESALVFAQYTEQFQLYDTAAEAYSYCADLFRYFYPNRPLPVWIYLPRLISCYNTQRSQHKCLDIIKDIRQNGHFDLFAEAFAAKAAEKIGDKRLAENILKSAEQKAIELAVGNLEPIDPRSQAANYEQLAWFYCFVYPDADSALDWANKAYANEPNSSIAAGMLAYALVMNGQTEWAKPLIENYQPNAMADLALAQIQLKDDLKNSAFEKLKSVIAADPGSLEAERAKEILIQNGGEYISPITPDIISTVLRNSFGNEIVPTFISPDRIISVQLNTRGSKFSYARNLGASLAVTNNFSSPLIISDDGLFKGNIRIDADITGDINKKIPNLISLRVRPSMPVKPGSSLLIPLRLVTAELKQILLTSPQASLDIEFTVFIDPVITATGEPANALPGISPAKITVKRPRTELDVRFMQNRLNTITKGKQGQKIKTAQLFIGLLAEQHAMANREPLYGFMYDDWMPPLLKAALTQHMADDDWVAKVHSMAAMLYLPLDYELINAVSENLNDTHWPARLMAVYLLAQNQDSDFKKVLDWTAQYDSNQFVRDMAVALGGTEPEPTTTEIPDPNTTTLTGPEA